MAITDGELLYKNLFTEKGYVVERYDKHLKTKSPDYKVLLNGDLLFYCEVKDIENAPFDYYRSEKELRDEVIIILNKIKEANEQFNTVNPNHSTPNILALHCKRLGMDANDLLNTVCGYVEYDNGFKMYRDHRGKFEYDTFAEPNCIDAFLFHNDSIDQYSIIYSPNSYVEIIRDMKLLEHKKVWGE